MIEQFTNVLCFILVGESELQCAPGPLPRLDALQVRDQALTWRISRQLFYKKLAGKSVRQFLNYISESALHHYGTLMVANGDGHQFSVVCFLLVIHIARLSKLTAASHGAE